MNNQAKIMKISTVLHWLVTVLLLAVPIYYVLYWALINNLPETLIHVNSPHVPLVSNNLSTKLQVLGFISCVLPLGALIYGLANVRKLFSLYRAGVIFSFEHVSIFKKVSRALVAWVFLSIMYESAKSVIFSIGNPPGQRVLQVGFGSAEMTTLIVAGITFAIAWVMDEGRILDEDNKLTV